MKTIIGDLELKPEIGAPKTEVYSPTETIEIVQLHLPVSGTMSSIAEDLAAMWEEEDPPEMEAREPVLESERSCENTSDREMEEAVRTQDYGGSPLWKCGVRRRADEPISRLRSESGVD